MKVQSPVEVLKERGHRMTQAREKLLELLSKASVPFSAMELQVKLSQKGLSANKTTVYRELEFLLKQGIVRAVEFGEGQKRYEILQGDHHHHLVCMKCGTIENIEMPNDIILQERKIARKKKFTITSHSLEFFGLCKKCNNEKTQ